MHHLFNVLLIIVILSIPLPIWSYFPRTIRILVSRIQCKDGLIRHELLFIGCRFVTGITWSCLRRIAILIIILIAIILTLPLLALRSSSYILACKVSGFICAISAFSPIPFFLQYMHYKSWAQLI
jgi:hypothetical protein